MRADELTGAILYTMYRVPHSEGREYVEHRYRVFRYRRWLPDRGAQRSGHHTATFGAGLVQFWTKEATGKLTLRTVDVCDIIAIRN